MGRLNDELVINGGNMAIAEDIENARKEGHCYACGGPLHGQIEEGCVHGECSYRPHEHSPEYGRWFKRATDMAKVLTFNDTLNEEGHKKRHEELHKCLDELVADWIEHTKGLPSKCSVLELMLWSHEQTLNPTEPEVDFRIRERKL